MRSSSTSDLIVEPDEVKEKSTQPPSNSDQTVSINNILWPLLLSVSVFGLIAYYTFDFETFKQLLRELNPWFLLAALGTVVIRVAFGALRLNFFSHGLLNLRDSVRSQLAWDFFAYVTPSTIGGGPVAAVFVSSDRKIPLGEATSIFLFSILMEQVWFALLMPASVVLSFYYNVFPDAMGTIGLSAMLTAFVIFICWVFFLHYSTLFNPKLLTVVVATVFRIKWIRKFRTRALRTMAELKQRSSVLRSESTMFYVKGFVISIVPWLSRYALPVFLIMSVYPAVDKLLAFFRAATLQLGALFLPTPGGAGGMEGLFLLFFSPPIQPEPLVAPTLLAWRFLSYYVFIFAGVFIAIQFIRRRVVAEE